MQAVTFAANAAMPLFIAAIVAYVLIKRVDIYESFIAGARQGAGLCFRILPYMVAMIFAVSMLRASGAFEAFISVLTPVTSRLGLPAELIPVAVMRPFSGGASIGMLAGIYAASGADSYVGRVASVYMGSSETLFYTVSLYFGSAGVKRTRYVVPVALFTDAVGMALSCLLCRYM